MVPDIDRLEADIPADAFAALADARNAYTDRDKAERAIHDAVKLAPDNLALRMAAYKFYFYANRLTEALPHAEICLAIAAGTLHLPADWRQVTADSANFDTFERPQRVYLQSLLALGYCRVRIGDFDEGLAILDKAASLDPKDRLGAGRLAEVVKCGDIDLGTPQADRAHSPA